MVGELSTNCIGNMSYMFLQLLKNDLSSGELYKKGDDVGVYFCAIPGFLDSAEKIIKSPQKHEEEISVLRNEVIAELIQGGYFGYNGNKMKHLVDRLETELEERDALLVQFFKECFSQASMFAGILAPAAEE